MGREELLEKLAELAHEQWSGWMKYLFGKCKKSNGFENGKHFEKEGLVIPKWAVDRWERQMNTPYKDLPEEEKESDREEAIRMIKVFKDYLIDE